MKMGLNVLGALLALTGIVWAWQGMGLLGGSFMTGERQWLWIGIGCVAAGVAVLIAANRTAAGR